MMPPVTNPFSRFAKAKKKEMEPNADDAQMDDPGEEAAETPGFEKAEEAGMKKAKK